MNKYTVPYVTLVRSQCYSSTYYRPVRYACSPPGCVTACVVYTADSIRDSIRTKKKRFAGP